ncbi:MAG: alpha/beta hydrolase [Deltaproteobacteria bacterium]|nr:alpha/beta hydrolase [Deltaproteobacteria bacterium]
MSYLRCWWRYLLCLPAIQLHPAVSKVDMTRENKELQAGTLPRFEPLEECFAVPPDDLDVKFDTDCGYVVVPEFYHGESNRELKLGTMRLTTGHGKDRTPLFMYSGGPGQTQISSENFKLYQPEMLGGILAERDIVLVEQRGVGHTDTLLDCPDFFSAAWAAYKQGLNAEESATFQVEIIENCIAGFKAQGINFDAYNDVENAADVNAVREALGYDRIIFYGASYGTLLAQHVMRDFPDILEAVVMDGTVALSRKSWVQYTAVDSQWGIDNLTKLCEADEKCRKAYDIPALVDASLAHFDNGPLPYSYTNPDDPTLTIKGELTKQDMAGLIHTFQGTGIQVSALPAILDQLVKGGAETAQEVLGEKKATDIIASRDATKGEEALLMHLAMVCSDDPVKSVDEVIMDGAGEYARILGKEMAEAYITFCRLINVKELPDSVDVNVTLDVPTLLLSGSLDVATPSLHSQPVVDALPNATLLTFPGRTHVQIGNINLCAAQIMTRFVLDPTTQLDTQCMVDAPKLQFVLPDGSMSGDAN